MPWVGWYAEETGHVFVNLRNIFFNFQVERDGRESNSVTNLSPQPRLKMTDIKEKPKKQQRRVKSILHTTV